MNKFFAFLSCLFILLGVNFCFADDDYEAEYPKIIFENKTEVMKVKAGDVFNFKIIVKNVGDNGAKYITLSNSDKEAPIYWETALDTYSIYRMSTGTKREIEVNLRVKETADVGIYALPFDITYSDFYGSEYSNKQTIHFEVVEEFSKPLILVRNVKITPEIVTADGEANLAFELFNTGDLDARRVKMTLKGTSKDGFMIKDSIDNRYFDNLDGKNSIDVNFDLLVSENIAKGTAALEVALQYFDQDNKEYNDTKTIYINNIDGTESGTKKGTPKIIVSSYNTDPETVTAGKTVNFEFSLKNTHTTKTIKNMKAIIDSEDGTFTLEGGSNSFYVSELKPEDEFIKSFKLRAKADALSRAYPITINFDYEDMEGNEYTTQEKINIPVVEKTDVTIDNISGPYEMYLGNTGYVSFEYYNRGKATISNLTVEVTGDYSSVNNTNYIGNVEAGSGSYSEVEVMANVAGDAKGNLVFSFEDSSGNIKKITRPIEGFVYGEMPTFEPDFGIDMMEPIEPQEKQLEWWKLVLIGVGTFLFVTIITRFITIKILMKKLEDEI